MAVISARRTQSIPRPPRGGTLLTLEHFRDGGIFRDGLRNPEMITEKDRHRGHFGTGYETPKYRGGRPA
jgi:hypothetical protein